MIRYLLELLSAHRVEEHSIVAAAVGSMKYFMLKARVFKMNIHHVCFE